MSKDTDQGAPEEVAKFLKAIPLERVPAAITVLAVRLLGAPEPAADPEQTRERYLSPDQITDDYGLDRRWVYANAERLGAAKLGRRTMRVPEWGLKRYLEAHRVGAGDA